MRIRTKGEAQHFREPRRRETLWDATCKEKRRERGEKGRREGESGQLSVGSPPVMLAGSVS